MKLNNMQFTACFINLVVLISWSDSVCSCLEYELEDLDIALKTYDKRVRPFKNIAPVEVKVQVYLLSFGPISTKTFTFEADIFLREWWIDPRINIKNGSVTLHDNPNLFLWVPDLFISNSHGADMHKMLSETVGTQISPNGHMFLSAGIKTSCSCNMNLQMYPMDSQTCTILFESYAYNGRKLNPVWHDQPLNYDKKSITVSGFSVRNITTDIYNNTYYSGEVFPRLRISFHMDRTFSYYLYRSYIPSIFLVMLSWGTFQIPANAYPARVTLIVSTFLASTFILQYASSEYTKVEYTTAIEIFLLVNICFIMTAMFEYMMVVRSHPRLKLPWCMSWKSKSSGKAVDTKKCDVEKAGSAYCNVTVNENEDQRSAGTTADNYLQVKNLKRVDTIQVQNLHNIDRVSRVLIPIAYIIFIVVYFSYFLS